MNYEKIIVELLSRIKDLEEKVEYLMDGKQLPEKPTSSYMTVIRPKVSTQTICEYIEEQKEIAKKAGEKYLVLKAGVIHRQNQLRNAMPIVCNAMRRCMREGDKVLFQTPSGYSSTLEIQYNLEDEE
ncbi:MAG: hypothetical protein IKJ50_04870 [Clostridia bacterium]|nr:hypothetical protein [Clostridia bacterium]